MGRTTASAPRSLPTRTPRRRPAAQPAGAPASPALPQTLLLLGAGELGKEVAISAKRLGCRVVACDSYEGAPAMQVADAAEVINMLDGHQISAVVEKHRPDHIVPEIEAIRTPQLIALEAAGWSVVPSAAAAHLTMNRDAIRDVAARELGLPTARFAYAESAEGLEAAILGEGGAGLPAVIKPVMSSSGKGQSVARTRGDIAKSWDYAVANSRGDTRRVIAEEFIRFEYEITLLTIKQRPGMGKTLFCDPIGHRQERGDYQESWMPCRMKPALLKEAQRQARAITDRIAGEKGAGIFGVEFFITGGRRPRVIFSELSPRPHDTGMVTLISQDLSEFDLHVRAVLGLPIPTIRTYGPSASAVILAAQHSNAEPRYENLAAALAHKNTHIRLFGKPSTRPYRRMGVALATAPTIAAARRLAARAAAAVRIVHTPVDGAPKPRS